MHLLSMFRDPQHQEQTSNTLVIHPFDPSTAFLLSAYEEKPYDVLHGSIHPLDDLMDRYEHLVFMGHGWVQGFFSMGMFPGSFAFEPHQAWELEGEHTYIWCQASHFVKAYGLHGFATGMFISEVGEAMCYQMQVPQSTVDESNQAFVNALRAQDTPVPDLERLLHDYDGANPIIQFNRELFRRF